MKGFIEVTDWDKKPGRKITLTVTAITKIVPGSLTPTTTCIHVASGLTGEVVVAEESYDEVRGLMEAAQS